MIDNTSDQRVHMCIRIEYFPNVTRYCKEMKFQKLGKKIVANLEGHACLLIEPTQCMQGCELL